MNGGRGLEGFSKPASNSSSSLTCIQLKRLLWVRYHSKNWETKKNEVFFLTLPNKAGAKDCDNSQNRIVYSTCQTRADSKDCQSWEEAENSVGWGRGIMEEGLVVLLRPATNTHPFQAHYRKSMPKLLRSISLQIQGEKISDAVNTNEYLLLSLYWSCTCKRPP